jgi:hypothetical protein
MKFNYRMYHTNEDVLVEYTMGPNHIVDSILIKGENDDFDFQQLSEEDQQSITDIIQGKTLDADINGFLEPFDWN